MVLLRSDEVQTDLYYRLRALNEAPATDEVEGGSLVNTSGRSVIELTESLEVRGSAAWPRGE